MSDSSEIEGLVFLFFGAIVAAAATAATVFFVVFVFHCFKALFHDLGQSFHLVLVCGKKLFKLAVDNDLHDIDFRAVFVLTGIVFTAAAALTICFGIDQYRVLLAFVIKIIYDLKFKLIAVVIRKNHQITFFFHAVHHLTVIA